MLRPADGTMESTTVKINTQILVSFLPSSSQNLPAASNYSVCMPLSL